jgi:DnaJ-class molecular chaperone
LDDLLGGMGGSGAFEGMHIDYGDGPGQPMPALPSPEAHVEVSLEEVAAGTERLVQIGPRKLEVRIPEGVADGQRIRLPRTAADGVPDATLVVHVARHPVFTRNGPDLTRELPLTLGEALLGAEVPVGTLSGKRLLLRIPENTQDGRTFRLTGQGLPHFRKEGRGDLYAKVRVVLPSGLDDEGRALARTFIDHIAQPDPRHGQPAVADRTA